MRKVLYIMGQLNDADITWMAGTGRQRAVPRGTALITEGMVSPSLFIVLEGEVDVEVKGLGRVASLGSGEVLGEMSFVDKAAPSATVKANMDMKVLVLDKRSIEERLDRDHAFAARFYKALAIFLADRLRGTVLRQKAGSGLGGTAIEEGELDEAVLDTVSVAGLRFQQMLRTLAAAAPSDAVRHRE